MTQIMLVVALANFTATSEDQMTLFAGTTYIRTVVDFGNGWSYGCSMDNTKQGNF